MLGRRYRTTDPAQRRLPPTAVAVAAGHVDLVAVYNVISQIVPEEDQPKLTNLDAVLTGVLMGQDLRTRVLPRLGPGVIAYLDSPPAAEEGRSGGSPTAPTRPGRSPSWWWCPWRKTDRPECSARDPAFESPRRSPWRTHWKMLCTPHWPLTAMDEKRNQGRSRITTQVGRGASVTTLDPPIPFAYAVDRAGSRLVLSTSARSVARYLEMAQEPKPSDRFRRLRAAAFPGDEHSFASTSISCAGWPRGTAIVWSKPCPPARTGRRPTSTATSRKCWPWPAYLRPRSSRAGIDRHATTVQRSVGLILHDANATATGRP